MKRRLSADVSVVQSAAGLPEQVKRDDPLLAALVAAHARRLQADREIRLLLAYARRFVYPHPYTLGELATAAGMSVSGVRTAYDEDDVDLVAKATGMEPITTEAESRVT